MNNKQQNNKEQTQQTNDKQNTRKQNGLELPTRTGNFRSASRSAPPCTTNSRHGPADRLPGRRRGAHPNS
eukprot:11182159-Lingulodinium_polyedra.AAC.1